jgi:hypothetical protein
MEKDGPLSAWSRKSQAHMRPVTGLRESLEELLLGEVA